MTIAHIAIRKLWKVKTHRQGNKYYLANSHSPFFFLYAKFPTMYKYLMHQGQDKYHDTDVFIVKMPAITR